MEQKNSHQDPIICIGVITSSVGIKGYVKINTFTENPEDLEDFTYIFDENNVQYELGVINYKKKTAVCKVQGIHSRNEANKLRNTKLYIKRMALPELANDEFYHVDLIGMSARLEDNTELGVVRNILNFGAGDILEIYNTASEKTLYYPFTKKFVPEIKLANKYIIINEIEETAAIAE